ncbi:MAG: serine/threonine-protein kinase [Phycisphaerae bacterium]
MMDTRYTSGTRISEYTLEAPIAAGSFGEVWRARHHVWETEHVAIKLPTSPEYVRYLQREGVVVHGIRHPNIVRVLGLDPYAEIPYLVMELVRGPSLRGVLQEHAKGLPVDAVIEILRGILLAMKAAHAAGVIHRDLKPGNVMLHLDGRPLQFVTSDDVKVGDFGLGLGEVESLRSIAQSASLDRDDKVVGTLAYMAPEVREGRRSADARADLYAIGVILFELLTGERPAGAELPSGLRDDVPGALDQLFSRLYVRYERRLGSAEEVLEQLERTTGNAGKGVPKARIPAPPTLRSRALAEVPCPSCGHPAESDAQFCVMCSSQLVTEVRRCEKCHAYPGVNDRYCIFCGTRLAGIDR